MKLSVPYDITRSLVIYTGHLVFLG